MQELENCACRVNYLRNSSAHHRSNNLTIGGGAWPSSIALCILRRGLMSVRASTGHTVEQSDSSFTRLQGEPMPRIPKQEQTVPTTQQAAHHASTALRARPRSSSIFISKSNTFE